uniref:Uncharacterized protein n=1 Tax=Arundo donax TaxID=35708 RepID=A0A0A9A5Z8_ARUDO
MSPSLGFYMKLHTVALCNIHSGLGYLADSANSLVLMDFRSLPNRTV